MQDYFGIEDYESFFFSWVEACVCNLIVQVYVEFVDCESFYLFISFNAFYGFLWVDGRWVDEEML